MRKSCLSLNSTEPVKIDILDDIILQSSTSTPQCMIPQRTPLDIPTDGLDNAEVIDRMFDEYWAKEDALSKMSLPPPPLVSPLPAKDDEVEFVEFQPPHPPKMSKAKSGSRHTPKGGKMHGPLLKKALKMAEKKNSQMRKHPYERVQQPSTILDLKPVHTEPKQQVRAETKPRKEPEPPGAASDDEDFQCFSQPEERQALRTVRKMCSGVDQKLAVERKKAQDAEVEIQHTREKLARLEEMLNLHRSNIVQIEHKKRLLSNLFK